MGCVEEEMARKSHLIQSKVESKSIKAFQKEVGSQKRWLR